MPAFVGREDPAVDVTGARASDEPAPRIQPRFREFIEEQRSFVCRNLRSLGVGEADLDDTLQEVFLVVSQRRREYENRRRARAWLYSVCARVAHAQRHLLGYARATDSELGVEAAIAPTQLAYVEDRESLDLVHELLGQIPPQEREVFLLYELEDLPMSKIAETLNCPLQTAYSRLYKARARILTKVERLALK
jgi:RNA polymerase sigma-70 factor (ECF subfamily)